MLASQENLNFFWIYFSEYSSEKITRGLILATTNKDGDIRAHLPREISIYRRNIGFILANQLFEKF